MKLGSILKKVGSFAVSTMIPGGNIIIDMVNEFLDDDKKLPQNATGTQIQEAIETLPPEQQASLLEKQLDVEIKEIEEWTNVVKALAEADATGSSTRPFIAKMMAWLIVFEIVIIIFPIARAVWTNNFETIKAISTAWPFIAFAIGVPAGVVNSYFGKRTKEKKARYSTATGTPAGNFLADIISAIKG